MNAEACVEVGKYRCGPGQPLLVIAGPCVIESEQLCQEIAKFLVEINQSLPVNIVFKASFDKANRTSIKSKRGIGSAYEQHPYFDRNALTSARLSVGKAVWAKHS